MRCWTPHGSRSRHNSRRLLGGAPSSSSSTPPGGALPCWSVNGAASSSTQGLGDAGQVRGYIESTKGISKRWVNEIFNSKNRLKWLDQVPQAVTPSTVRKEKDRYIRQLIHGTDARIGDEETVVSVGNLVKQSQLEEDAFKEKKNYTHDMYMYESPVRDTIKGSAFGRVHEADEDVAVNSRSMESMLVGELSTFQSSVRTQTEKHKTNENITEALEMYRMLRPDAAPFYEEDAMLHMEKNVNRLLNKTGKELENTNDYVRFSGHVPVVNPNAFILALQAVTNSLADDLELLLKTVLSEEDLKEGALPQKGDAFRFAKIMDLLLNNVFEGLRKIPNEADRTRNIKKWMDRHWDTLSQFFPTELRHEREKIEEWLHGHMGRVIHNQAEDAKKIWQGQRDDDVYRFSEDFAYDQYPLAPRYVDERNLEFPLEEAGKYFDRAMQWGELYGDENNLDSSAYEAQDGAADSFQEFVWDLEKIGLRNWLKMDVEKELIDHLPNWRTGGLSAEDAFDVMKYPPETREVAETMLRCAARGKSNLLDFEAVDPEKLLHEFPRQEVAEELARLPENPHITDAELTGFLDALYEGDSRSQRPTEEWKGSKGSSTSMEDVVNEEMSHYRKYGPLEWTGEGEDLKPKWRRPANTSWDPKRQCYIPEKAIDPLLKVGGHSEMRQVLLSFDRMGSMNKDGRIYFFRAIVAVGNGRGTFGFGVGFGNNMNEAKTDGALKALQNLEHLDYDELRMLCTPCMGEEYAQRVEIIPRPLGRGVVCNKKFLPLVYLLGLDNVKIRFYGTKWFSRVKALKRALDQIVSRRTMANMTGQKYASIVAPGDHWVHWPDRWFDQVRDGYDATYKKAKLDRKHALKYKKRGNIMATASELRPGVTKFFHKSPLERHFRKRHFDLGIMREKKGAETGSAAS